MEDYVPFKNDVEKRCGKFSHKKNFTVGKQVANSIQSMIHFCEKKNNSPVYIQKERWRTAGILFMRM